MNVSHTARVFGLEVDLLLRLCENIGSARAQCVYMLAKSGEWKQILDLTISHSDYTCWKSFMDDYQVTMMMSKNPRLPLSIDKRDVALSKFWEAERLCTETNELLEAYAESRLLPAPDVHRAVHYARENIGRILGPLTRSDLRYAESKMRFGPGATTSLSGVVTQGAKYSRRILDATPRVADFRVFSFPSSWKEHVSEINLRETSKLTTVPKSAKTDRVICIEPDLNIFVQLGIGALLREKLRKVGLDLSTQENNRELAKQAHVRDLCTMDLSSASDTISREAVWCLLPFEWADLLHFARVDKTLVDGKVHTLSKWSSMGNGYTFELESAIFYGVLLGCREALGVEGEVIAYGDDLIFPTELLDLVTRTLSFLGFKVNRDKTFGKGSFHESCGTDWFLGINVRPFFLRSDHHDFPTICYIYANSLRRWANRRNSGQSCDVRCLPAWFICFNAVKPSLRFSVPEGFGDVGFSVEFDRATPSVIRLVSRQADKREPRDRLHPDGWSGYSFSYRRIAAKMTKTYHEGSYLASLNFSAMESSKGESMRGRFSPATTRRGHSLEWPSLGPWQ